MCGKVFFVICLAACCSAQEDLICHEPGECQQSVIEHVSVTSSYNECLESCKNYPTCEYLSFNKDGNACTFYVDCPDISADICEDCHTGQKGPDE